MPESLTWDQIRKLGSEHHREPPPIDPYLDWLMRAFASNQRLVDAVPAASARFLEQRVRPSHRTQAAPELRSTSQALLDSSFAVGRLGDYSMAFLQTMRKAIRGAAHAHFAAFIDGSLSGSTSTAPKTEIDSRLQGMMNDSSARAGHYATATNAFVSAIGQQVSFLAERFVEVKAPSTISIRRMLEEADIVLDVYAAGYGPDSRLPRFYAPDPMQNLLPYSIIDDSMNASAFALAMLTTAYRQDEASVTTSSAAQRLIAHNAQLFPELAAHANPGTINNRHRISGGFIRTPLGVQPSPHLFVVVDHAHDGTPLLDHAPDSPAATIRSHGRVGGCAGYQDLLPIPNTTAVLMLAALTAQHVQPLLQAFHETARPHLDAVTAAEALHLDLG